MSLPRVIKLTRHPHPLSHTPFLPPSVLSCGVCYRAVDVRFGQYSCDREDCSYVVHSKCATHNEICAGLPRELDHPLHKHRIVLDPTPLDDYDYMNCSTSSRTSSGFRYKCIERECKLRTFHIDLRCILIPECSFTHKSHEHPLFISVSYGLEGGPRCNICEKGCAKAILRCSKCEFTMCFRCATIPTELHYKRDHKHPLSLCCGESVDNFCKFSCEICKMEVDAKKWFYKCNQCCVTVHRECIFNASIYMKSGSTFDWNGYLVRTGSTNSPTRQICAVLRIYIGYFHISCCNLLC